MPQTPWKPRVLIVMPTFNEAENLPKIVPAVLDAAPVEVLVVDDSSPDGTGRLADEMAARDPRVHVLHRTTKDGLGRAYLAGFRWGIERGYDVLFEMDADFSHQPKYLPTMIRHTEDFDVVVGSRYIQGGGTENWGLHRRLLSQGGGLYARSVLGVQVKDLTAGFIAWRRTALEAIDLDTVTTTGYGFQIEGPAPARNPHHLPRPHRGRVQDVGPHLLRGPHPRLEAAPGPLAPDQPAPDRPAARGRGDPRHRALPWLWVQDRRPRPCGVDDL
jgi:dolichol-phosphate mannosyltransferase